MVMCTRFGFFAVCLARWTTAYNFPYEATQLQDSDVANNSDLAFGVLPGGITENCKTFPGDNNWPSTQRWAALNASLDGALIQAVPPTAACYQGPFYNAAKCENVKRQSGNSLFA